MISRRQCPFCRRRACPRVVKASPGKTKRKSTRASKFNRDQPARINLAKTLQAKTKTTCVNTQHPSRIPILKYCILRINANAKAMAKANGPKAMSKANKIAQPTPTQSETTPSPSLRATMYPQATRAVQARSPGSPGSPSSPGSPRSPGRKSGNHLARGAREGGPRTAKNGP